MFTELYWQCIYDFVAQIFLSAVAYKLSLINKLQSSEWDVWLLLYSCFLLNTINVRQYTTGNDYNSGMQDTLKDYKEVQTCRGWAVPSSTQNEPASHKLDTS